ncbi:type II toxin-antitoxin system RelB/DinJ family antitoxin [Mailhella sp.]|uniref:type II toxin-antitoxin system RelB/DinJ family antitoxin n=1 Tax=Mailhella sp. TaxID=1981029 RepID=UPI0040633E74
MATLQIRIDDDLRGEASAVAQGMGIDLSAAIRIFLTQMVKENGLPFRPTNDPFYSAANMAALRRSMAQFENGETVTRSLADLEAMEQ